MAPGSYTDIAVLARPRRRIELMELRDVMVSARWGFLGSIDSRELSFSFCCVCTGTSGGVCASTSKRAVRERSALSSLDTKSCDATELGMVEWRNRTRKRVIMQLSTWVVRQRLGWGLRLD